MTRTLPILLLAATALAGEKEAIEAFRKVRGDSGAVADQPRVEEAIEELARMGGVESIGELARYLHDGVVEWRRIVEVVRETKVRGREAFEAIDRIRRELEHLRHRQKSGATGLGPQIEERQDKLDRARAEFEKVKIDTAAAGRRLTAIEEVRQKGAAACTRILRRVPADRVGEAVRALRSALDPADEEESLLFVRILRQAKRPGSAPALLDIFGREESPDAARIEAACAVAVLGDRAALRTLLARFDDEDESATRRLLHAISRVARKKIESLDAAKAWAAE